MTLIKTGAIPTTVIERKALSLIDGVASLTREGELLQVETDEGQTYWIHPDGTVERR